ncbi:MAG: CotH kinase family protein [Candidatus Cloacimonas sp.]
MKKAYLVLCLMLSFVFSMQAQTDFYDMGTVNTIQLFFTQSNWDQILDQLYAAGEDRLIGTAIINGVTYDSVGVRYKGNSSYSANRNKNPFNIKVDHIIEDQLIDGKYGTIKLANGFSDPSLVRETLSYEIARKYMPACKANYANVWVNNVLIGVYTSVEDVDSNFMAEHFHTSGKPRFKCDTNTMGTVTVWGYLGADSTAYMQYYGLESDYGWNTLINFTNTLQNNYANIDQVMNVDQNLWMCAFDNLLVNLDAPINVFHNFYLFGDADNRINPLLWDLNMSFGGFQGGSVSGMQNLDPLRNSTSSTFLLLKNVLNNSHYKKMYIAHMRTMIEENFSNGWYATRAAELQSVCGPSVQNDTNYFYTYANFQANLNSQVGGGSGGPGGGQTVPGITQLMNARATYLLSNTNFAGTIPTMAAQSYSPENPEPGSTLQFTATFANATYAQLGIRQNIASKFTYYQMFDDGAHSDGSANDGVYGISVPISYGDINYYFWAENSSQGMFFPARAEHEYFTIAVSSFTGELFINEIMAKNASFADPNGDFDDWVEIYNPNNYAVDLGGMYMTDSHYSNGISAWTQIPTTNPDVTTIPAHSYKIVWYDEELDQGPLHINDKLGGGADAVYLIDSDGVTLVDSYIWTETTDLNVDDRSIGRLPDGTDNWVLFGTGQTNPCTPGASNQGTVNTLPVIENIAYNPLVTDENSIITISASVSDSDGSINSVQLLYGISDWTLNTVAMSLTENSYTAQIGPFALGSIIKYRIQATDNVSGVTQSPVYTIVIGYSAPILYINELMPSNTATVMDENSEYEDWVEIYNPNNFEVDLAGYYFTDDHYPDTGTSLTQIPTGFTETIIPASGYKIIWFDEDLDQGSLHINTKLSATADAVYLIAPDMLTLIDHIAWTEDLALASDISYGRYPDGSENWVKFGTDFENPVTPGTQNYPTGNSDDSITPVVMRFEVWPNPVRDALNINLKGAKDKYRVKVYNLKGQLVTENVMASDGKNQWDLRDKNGNRISSGIYLIRTQFAGKQFSKKICIIQ